MKVYMNKQGQHEIWIYDQISRWGVSAQKVTEAVNRITAKKLTVRLSSPGGSINEGLAIYNYLKSCPKEITVMIDSTVASIATIIAMAGDRVEIAETARFMIHNPWIDARGNSRKLREMAELLDKFRDDMIMAYQTRSKLTKEQLIKAMDKETWYAAKEAVTNGFCDSIFNANKSSKAHYDIVAYAMSHGWTLPEEIQNTPTDGGLKMDELLKVLGCSNEQEALLKVQQLAADNSSLKEKITEIEARQNKLNAEAAVNSAIAEKKLLPSEKDFAMSLYAKDEKLFNEYLASKKVTTLDVTEPVESGTPTAKKDYGYYLNHQAEWIELCEKNEALAGKLESEWDPYTQKEGE